MHEKIATFLKNNHLLHLSLISEGAPYAASCFYRYDPIGRALLFASSTTTLHMQALMRYPRVAGTIACCDQNIATLQGVQFVGEVAKATKEQRSLYYRAYPVALAMDEPIWAIELSWIKMTDNSLGFGRKIEWRR
ncbi:MAG: hypothetical protein C6H99_05715 [Epsilonproteobacteria bacterium]|nr:hypothetical protein [Campylobacterota bacterium]NPA64274.1 hypothetical protein [Campylobacterota bacterium]